MDPEVFNDIAKELDYIIAATRAGQGDPLAALEDMANRLRVMAQMFGGKHDTV